MLHKAAERQKRDHAAPYKSLLGVKMFLVYAVVYAGFVAINVIDATLMEKTILFGLNLAVVYGFGLIIFALFLAVIYNHKCAAEEKSKGGQE